MSRIALIAWDNGVGLSTDMRILRAALEQLGHEVATIPVGPPRQRHRLKGWILRLRMAWRAMRSRGREPARYDLAIALEHTQPDYLAIARRNVFIANPEWLSRRDRHRLHRYDALFAKTAVAARDLAGLGPPVYHVGFSSPDCRREETRCGEFLHLAGASRTKGTDRLIALWLRHPEWPRLRVIQSPRRARPWPQPLPPNLEHRIEYVRDIDEIRRLQNSHLFHLCPSETEGWGHYIVEAMSCGAIVVTGDAPPMNELVTAGRGVLADAREAGTLNMARVFHVDDDAMETAIAHALSLDPSARDALSQSARSWFEANHARFVRRLGAAIDRMLGFPSTALDD